MARKQHFTLRLDPETLGRLARQSEHLGEPRAALAERYIEEGVRMAEHPGIVFRDGPAGRRPGLAGHRLDVWEVVETVLSEDRDPDAAAAVRLLLDEHSATASVLTLRERGYDVTAVAESSDLRELPDQALLLWAEREQRVLVTENVCDFMRLQREWIRRGEAHPGLLFTSPRAYPRRMSAVGRLIDALMGDMARL